jgi:hypothetical protein
MDAAPERFYYVALPRLAGLRWPERLSARSGPGRRSRHRAALLQTWWAAHSVDAAVWMLAITLAVGVGVVVAKA